MLQFLITLGGISLVMSVVIILMLILQKPIKKRFAALGRYIIWSVIIVRLCLPVSLNVLPKLITLPSAIPEAETVIYEPVTPEVNYTPEEITPSEPASEIIKEPVSDNTISSVQTPSMPVVPQKPAFEITGEHIITALFAVWAVGAVAFVTVTLIRYRINAKRLDATLNIPAPELWSIYDTVCRELNIKKAPPLYMGRADVSPMVYGFFNPKVVLPSAEMSAQSTAYILRHELTHYKRGDLWFKLLAMLANAIHWFNPLAYAACGMMSAEAELSCDESALRKTDLMGRLGYGNSMLEIVKLCRHAPKLTTGFSPKKRAVKERFENMINTTKKKKGYWIVALIVAAALICTSLIGCATKSGIDEKSRFAGVSEEELFEREEFRVNLNDWQFVYDNDRLVLKNPNGKRFEYGSAQEGVIGVEHVYEHTSVDYMAQAAIFGEYASITYGIAPSLKDNCDRICVLIVDTKDGSILEEISYSAYDILAMHGMAPDDLEFYNGKWIEELTYSMGTLSEYEKNDGNLSLEGTEIFIRTTSGEEVSCFIPFNEETVSFGKAEPEHCNLPKGLFVSDIEDIYTLDVPVDEATVTAYKAFLFKDTATLEKLADYPSGMLEPYKTLGFGEYLFRANEDRGSISLYIRITKSEMADITPGIYSFGYIENDGVGYIQHSERIDEEYTEVEGRANEASSFVESWITHANDPIIPYGEQYNDGYFAGVLHLLKSKYEARTLDDYRREAKRVFGIDILTDVYADEQVQMDNIETINLYTSTHYYSPYFPRKTLQYGEKEMIVQFYADYGSTIPAYKVRYKFTLDGDDLVFRGCEKFDDTGRDIRQLYYMEYEVISD